MNVSFNKGPVWAQRGHWGLPSGLEEMREIHKVLSSVPPTLSYTLLNCSIIFSLDTFSLFLSGKLEEEAAG